MKLFIKKYGLIFIYLILGYVLFLLPFFSYTNPFANFWNYGLIIVFLFCLDLRLLDDVKDYYKDKIEDKTLFPKSFLAVLFLGIFLIACILIVILKKWIFFLPFSFLLLMSFWENKGIKMIILPILFFALGYQEFSLHYSLAISIIIVFIISFLFSLKKKNFKIEDIGGKAYNLWKLNIKNTPKFTVIPSAVLEMNQDEKIQAYISDFCKKNKLYAVRSSAIDEDSETHSFAGIHDTYLNVAYSDIFDSVLKVKASATKELALAYRKQNHLSTDQNYIAVIIQEMVEADFAGVINTINPVTNNFNEIVVSVCKGLGDKLVDGTSSGTTYYIQNEQVRCVGEDLLSKAQINALVKLTNQIISKTDRFQDIEFAIVERKVYFLQARPIATYASINPHKMTMLIDNSNIIESYYGVTSDLTYSFAKDIYEKVYTETLKVGKVRRKILNALKPSLENMLYRYKGKIYYNLKSWYHVTSIFPSKKSLKYMESMMGVNASSEQYKRVHLNLLDMMKIGIIFLKKIKKIDALSETFIKNFNEIVEPYYGKEITGTCEELKTLYQRIEKEIIPEFTTPILNDCAVMFYFGRLKEKTKKYPNSETLLNQAICNYGNVESIQSAKEFEKLVEQIKASANLYTDFTTLSSQQLFDKYYNSSLLIGNLLRKYIYSYGARVMNELKLETMTMIEEPIILFDQLKQALVEKNINSYSLDFYQEIPKKLRKLSLRAKTFIQRRESLRLRRTYIFSVVRNIFLAYGKNLVSSHEIDKIDDIFYLTKEEIFSDVKEKRKIILERKKEFELFKDKPCYNRIAFFDDVILPVKTSKLDGDLVGIPSGTGAIKAHVSKMESSKDFLKKGNIILTRRTDPGWISLFPLASGLIVEHGSMLSHSFVVAREMGLPAVVGVEGAMEKIPDNALVLLDGVEGVITVEDEKIL